MYVDGRFRLVAYDQRGHGDSASVTGPMSLARGVADVEDVAAALGEPVDVLLGHSWGGAVAILAGARLPVARIATVDPMIRQAGADWYDEFLTELRELFALTGDERDARVREEYRDWPALDVAGKVHAVHLMTAQPIADLERENPPDRWDLRETIARYEESLLLVFAAPGESINDEVTLEQVERNHSASVSIARVPNAGHNLHRTAFEHFARVLDDWLALTRS
jgi:pimeloyl-ACP methyl ester carboxylesterase